MYHLLIEYHSILDMAMLEQYLSSLKKLIRFFMFLQEELRKIVCKLLIQI